MIKKRNIQLELSEDQKDMFIRYLVPEIEWFEYESLRKVVYQINYSSFVLFWASKMNEILTAQGFPYVLSKTVFPLPSIFKTVPLSVSVHTIKKTNTLVLFKFGSNLYLPHDTLQKHNDKKCTKFIPIITHVNCEPTMYKCPSIELNFYTP